MNFQTIFEELDRLYEEESAKVAAEEAAEEVLTEAAEEEATGEPIVEEEPVEEVAAEDDEEIEIVDDVEAQLVLECTKCGGLVIKAEADVTMDEEAQLANIGDACQYCESEDGYKTIGTFSPYEAAEEEVVEDEVVEEETAEEANDELVEEGLLDVDMPISVDLQADGNTVSVGTLG